MSSMFKKKGGPAFKPKVPSARPRAPASSAPSQSQKPAEPRPLIEESPETTPADDSLLLTVPPKPIESAPQSDTTTEATEIAKTTAEPQEDGRRPLDSAPEPEKEQVTSIERSPADVPTSETRTSTRTSARTRGAENNATPAETSTAPLIRKPVPSAPAAKEPIAAIEPLPTASSTEDKEPATIPAEPETSTTTVSTTDTTDPATSISDPTPATETAATQPARKPAPKRTRKAAAKTTAESDGGADGVAPAPKRRQRKAPAEGQEASQPKPKRRKASTPGSDSQTKSRRARSLTPEDAEEQVVDLQTLKMADLTKDLHIGKKFSRHDELRERERKTRLKARLEKDGEPTEETNADTEAPTTTQQPRPKSTTPGSSSAAAPPSGPQFRIVDGQIIVDQSSLVMDRHARAAAAQAGEDMETIEENDFTRLITSSSFMNTSKLKGPNIWNDEETELFYRGLRMFGTDFEIISKMFPTKQRRHIKLKFNREERHNPKRIDSVLIGEKTIKIDIEEYTRQTGSEFEPVENIEAEQRRMQDNFDAERQRIVDEQEEEMRKKREELFADEDGEGGKKKRKKGKKGKQVVQYGMNGEPIAMEG